MSGPDAVKMGFLRKPELKIIGKVSQYGPADVAKYKTFYGECLRDGVFDRLSHVKCVSGTRGYFFRDVHLLGVEVKADAQNDSAEFVERIVPPAEYAYFVSAADDMIQPVWKRAEAWIRDHGAQSGITPGIPWSEDDGHPRCFVVFAPVGPGVFGSGATQASVLEYPSFFGADECDMLIRNSVPLQ